MSQSISISVPYNHLAISSAANMLTKLAEDIKEKQSEPVQVPEEPKKVLTEADALADLNGEPRPDNPSLEANSYEPAKAVYDAKAVFAPPPPVAETPVPPAAPVETPEDSLDANGLPWDERIHAGSKTKDAKGAWKYKRGVDRDVLVPEVEAELKAMVGEPVEDESVPTPPAPPAPAAETPAPPAPPVATDVTPSANVTTFAQLVTGITANSIPEDKVSAAVAAVGLQNFALLGARADLIPTVAGHLGL